MKSAPAIAFDYVPSRWLAAAIVAIALLALSAIAFAGLGAWSKLGLGGLAVAYAAVALRRHLVARVRRVAWHQAGHWRVSLADGEERVAELRHAVARAGWLVLNLHASDSDGERFALLLGPDNSDAGVRRLLRVRLARAREVTAR